MIDFIKDINRDYEDALNYKVIDRFILKVIYWHLGVFLLVAFLNSYLKLSNSFPSPLSWRVISTQDALVAVSIALVATLIPAIFYRRLSNHYLWRILITVTLTIFSYLFVFISGGSIEMHFHFFIIAALVVVYADWRLGWILLAMTGLHHGVLNYFEPGWVYFYGKNDLSVISHAIPVLVLVIFTTVLSKNTRELVINLLATRKHVEERTIELEKLKSGLEQTVKEKTEELQNKLTELEKMNSLMIGREMKMIDMKKELDELKKTTPQ